MPLGKIELNTNISNEEKEKIAKLASKIVAKEIGKPENYVMLVVKDDIVISMGGNTNTEAAFIEIKSIGGLNPSKNNNISNAICKLLNDELNISPSNIYINFTDINHSNWGWNSSTF